MSRMTEIAFTSEKLFFIDQKLRRDRRMTIKEFSHLATTTVHNIVKKNIEYLKLCARRAQKIRIDHHKDQKSSCRRPLPKKAKTFVFSDCCWDDMWIQKQNNNRSRGETQFHRNRKS